MAQVNQDTDDILLAEEDDYLSHLSRCATEYSPVPMFAAEGRLHHVRYANPAFRRLIGKAKDELISLPFADAAPEGTENGCIALLDRVYRTKQTETLADQPHSQPALNLTYWSYTAWAIPVTEQFAAGVMVQVTNTTEAVLFRLKVTGMNQELLVSSVVQHELTEATSALNARLESLATTDGLTGMKNHRTFQDRLREEVDRAHRHKTPLSVLFLDVDDFKDYNDTYGHPAGDTVLQRIAEALHATARAHDLVARYGGEEFAVIVTDTDVESAVAAGERFRAAVEALVWPERQITVSVGAATLSLTAGDPTALIVQADKAMYRSKTRGRNRVTHSAVDVDAPDAMRFGPRPALPMMPQALDWQDADMSAALEIVKLHLQHSCDAMIACWSRLVGYWDEGTQEHSLRVAELMERLAGLAGMSPDETLLAKRGALLHDIGKIVLPKNLLNKPGPLTDEERAIMQLHPALADEMLTSMGYVSGPAIEIPHYHHERWDGSGYPHGLKGKDIPRSARLFAVVDVYDALTSGRPYREAWTESDALRCLESLRGTHLDPHAVELFLTMLQPQDQE